ncbi:RNase H domain-containing protein [Trichonephila clavipes]|nr:RNase H domain-containing protein [Trichonephila clavipes]
MKKNCDTEVISHKTSLRLSSYKNCTSYQSIDAFFVIYTQLEIPFSEIWILTDNPSSIQHLSNWPSISDNTSRSILHLSQQLSNRHHIHLQWVPSHVGQQENEVVDDHAKVAISDPVYPEDHMVHTSTEIYNRAKELICRIWVVPPVHLWYFQIPWIHHIIQGFQIISDGILAIFDWSPQILVSVDRHHKLVPESDEIVNLNEEAVDLARQIKLEVNNDDVQELMDSHHQELTIDELIEVYEQEQDIKELKCLDPVPSEDRMTVGNLTEGLRLIEKGSYILENTLVCKT